MKLMPVDSIGRNTHAAGMRAALIEGERPAPRLHDNSSRPRTGFSPFDLFQWLSAEGQQAFVMASRRRHCADGSRIYSQSEPGNEMYRIVSGSVRMSVLRHDGREALYLVLEPGDCFGICSLIDGAPRPHTTSANGAVELQVLRREACERLRSQHPAFGDGLLRLMTRHMRLLNEYFVSSTLDELSCRVAQRLLKAQRPSVISGHGIRLTVRLSQSEIALMVGASRQAVNKVLQKFQEDGLISIEYGSVQVHDVDRLQFAT